jgi:hypothetical protein
VKVLFNQNNVAPQRPRTSSIEHRMETQREEKQVQLDNKVKRNQTISIVQATMLIYAHFFNRSFLSVSPMHDTHELAQ